MKRRKYSMYCKICGFPGGGDFYCDLLGHDILYSDTWVPMFRRSILLQCSILKQTKLLKWIFIQENWN